MIALLLMRRLLCPAWFDDADLSANEKALILHFQRRGNGGDGTIYPSIQGIASALSCGVTTAKATLKGLVKNGVITRHPRPGKTTIYKVHLDQIKLRPGLDSDHHLAEKQPGSDSIPGHIPAKPGLDSGHQPGLDSGHKGEQDKDSKEGGCPATTQSVDELVENSINDAVDAMKPETEKRYPLKSVFAHAERLGISKAEAERFHSHYEAQGWEFPSGAKVRNIPAALKRWMSNDKAKASRVQKPSAKPKEPATYRPWFEKTHPDRKVRHWLTLADSQRQQFLEEGRMDV
ncbi:MAG: helix-turn-helix domain-containing protein [Verrucomicrobiota bacterium]